MPEYRVSWHADIEAATPKEAALKAQAQQQTNRPEYWSGVFDVTERKPGALTVVVDLDQGPNGGTVEDAEEGI